MSSRHEKYQKNITKGWMWAAAGTDRILSQALHWKHPLCWAFSVLFRIWTPKKMFIFEFITNVRRITIVCLTQQSLFPTVNSAPVSDYISSVPITSWPLMFANSSLAAGYVREVRGTCRALSATHLDQASRGMLLPAFVYHCSLTKDIVCSQWAMTLHTDQVWLQLSGNSRYKPRSRHNPSCSQPCAYMTRSELKWTIIE